MAWQKCFLPLFPACKPKGPPTRPLHRKQGTKALLLSFAKHNRGSKGHADQFLTSNRSRTPVPGSGLLAIKAPSRLQITNVGNSRRLFGKRRLLKGLGRGGARFFRAGACALRRAGWPQRPGGERRAGRGRTRPVPVAKRVGCMFYVASFPVAFPLQPLALQPTDGNLPPAELRPASTGSVASSPYGGTLLPSRVSPKQENGTPLMAALGDPAKPPS
ncbi:uncharacterized protein LOC134507169 [Candoia aspera]|uniref:uncharacterized protein LOC134507169 n=1 Tax=Candoia aspera TaxID=51853 RepID=UPI002FD7B58C